MVFSKLASAFFKADHSLFKKGMGDFYKSLGDTQKNMSETQKAIEQSQRAIEESQKLIQDSHKSILETQKGIEKLQKSNNISKVAGGGFEYQGDLHSPFLAGALIIFGGSFVVHSYQDFQLKEMDLQKKKLENQKLMESQKGFWEIFKK